MKNKYINDKKINKEINNYFDKIEKNTDNLRASASFISYDLNVDEAKWDELSEICENFLDQLNKWKNNFSNTGEK